MSHRHFLLLLFLYLSIIQVLVAKSCDGSTVYGIRSNFMNPYPITESFAKIDVNTGDAINKIPIQLPPNFVFLGNFGLTQNPVSGEIFTITYDVTNGYLSTLSLNGNITLNGIAPVGLATLTSSCDILYGMTGDAATDNFDAPNPSTIYIIDKADPSASTLLLSRSSGAGIQAGEAIGYNFDNNMLYRISGKSIDINDIVFECFDPKSNDPTSTINSIGLYENKNKKIWHTIGQVRSLTYVGNGEFIATGRAGNVADDAFKTTIFTLSIYGEVSNARVGDFDDLRGLIAINSDGNICGKKKAYKAAESGPSLFINEFSSNFQSDGNMEHNLINITLSTSTLGNLLAMVIVMLLVKILLFCCYSSKLSSSSSMEHKYVKRDVDEPAI